MPHLCEALIIVLYAPYNILCILNSHFVNESHLIITDAAVVIFVVETL